MSDESTQLVLQLFVRHQARIKGFIVALLGDYLAAEDVLQETFLVVQQKAGDFLPDSNFLAWAFQISRLQVMKHRLFGQRARQRFSDDVIDALTASVPVEVVDDSQRTALVPCLEKLAPQARRIIDLFYQHEHSPQEIAKLLNWTAAAVSVALSRARRVLRECIEQRLRGDVT
jgi:RNA polymerase sigma-70 factor, ECF subfamily